MKDFDIFHNPFKWWRGMEKMLTFLGDVYLSDQDEDFSIKTSDLGDYVFNFEYAYYDKEFPHALHKALLKSKKDIRGTFHRLPIAVDINNNHIFDYDEAGVQNTMQYLKSIGVQFFGVGGLHENYNNPCIIECDGKKVALLGYYHRDRDRDSKNSQMLHQAFFSEEMFLKDVAAARVCNADYIIPSIHGGVEHSPGFTSKQQKAAHFMIENGADFVIGHHPHCIQPIEIYKGKYIFYSLGNFAFHEIYTKSWYTDETHSECMHCKRWHKWSRESLGVSIDLKSGKLKVRKFCQGGKTGMAVKERNIPSDKILKKYMNVKNIKQRTFIRKVILAFSSFTFFKGHIFYYKGFRQMCGLFFNMHIKEKNMKYPE